MNEMHLWFTGVALLAVVAFGYAVKRFRTAPADRFRDGGLIKNTSFFLIATTIMAALYSLLAPLFVDERYFVQSAYSYVAVSPMIYVSVSVNVLAVILTFFFLPKFDVGGGDEGGGCLLLFIFLGLLWGIGQLIVLVLSFAWSAVLYPVLWVTIESAPSYGDVCEELLCFIKRKEVWESSWRVTPSGLLSALFPLPYRLGIFFGGGFALWWWKRERYNNDMILKGIALYLSIGLVIQFIHSSVYFVLNWR
jgi:hypothetical protein